MRDSGKSRCTRTPRSGPASGRIWAFSVARVAVWAINAPAVFQRWVSSIFGDLVDRGVQTYIDDILIHSPTEEGLLLLFQEVLRRMRESGAKAKMEKVKIAPRRMKYLGQILEDGRRYSNLLGGVVKSGSETEEYSGRKTDPWRH